MKLRLRYIYSPDISVDCWLYTSYQQVLELSLAKSHLPCENAVLFLLLKLFTQYLFLFHLVPITVGWTEMVWIQRLPKAFTHDQLLVITSTLSETELRNTGGRKEKEKEKLGTECKEKEEKTNKIRWHKMANKMLTKWCGKQRSRACRKTHLYKRQGGK